MSTRVSPQKPVELSLTDFATNLAKKQAEFLDGFLLGLKNGELSLDLEHAPAFIESIVDKWCSTDSPTRALHLQMISAIYLWMVMEAMDAEDLDEDSESDETSRVRSKDQVEDFIETASDVVDFVRNVWKVANGKKKK
jgi:hypothetical protein